MKLRLSLAATLILGSLFAQAPEYGPAKGTLVIQGGGASEGTGIVETFIRNAGGLHAKIVVVPTAGGNKNPDGTIRAYKEETVLASWKKRGLTNVFMLHTHDPKVAGTEEFAKILYDANAVWFDGGRQWNIVDSYANTLTLREFHKVLNGGVIGSSASATIQGDYLAEPSLSEIVMTPELSTNTASPSAKVAIVNTSIPPTAGTLIIPVIKKYPNLLGIGPPRALRS
jgi:cyanophycinase